jgi:hypothetical protein
VEPGGGIPTACAESEEEWIALDQHYAGYLGGGEADRVYLSPGPGQPPGQSYGLGGDYIEARAAACSEGQSWVQIAFPITRYKVETVGWVASTDLTLE